MVMIMRLYTRPSCESLRPHFQQRKDADERNELDALRLENDTLRRNLGRLEEKLRSAEEHAQAHAEASQPQGRVGTSGMGQSAPLEVRQLNGILQWLNVRH